MLMLILHHLLQHLYREKFNYLVIYQGLASAPVITTGAITLTKMANLTSTSSLIGSSSTSTSPSQLSLGSNLQISGTTLNVNTVHFQEHFYHSPEVQCQEILLYQPEI